MGMKRITSLLLAFVFLFGTVQNVFGADKYITLNEPTKAVVTEVIDAESLLVNVEGTEDYAYVRMIANNSMADNDAYDYVTNQLLGKLVYLVPDSYVESPIGVWNQMYVYIGNVNFNDLLVKRGYVKVDNNYHDALAKGKLDENQKDAKDSNLGIWDKYPNTYREATNAYPNKKTTEVKKVDKNDVTPDYLKKQININTANATELSIHLSDVSIDLANKIVAYRQNNDYYNNAEQLMRVSGFTQNIFDKNKDKIVVVTNINTATAEEIGLLNNITSSEASTIIKYRDNTGFSSTADLYYKDLLSLTKYNSNKNYIALTYKKYVFENINGSSFMVNINTASVDQLEEYLTDVDWELAENIVAYREENDYFSSINQIRNVDNFNRMIYDDNRYQMTVITNISTATEDELATVGFTEDEIEDIVAYRDRYGFISTRELTGEKIISESKYESIKRFVTAGENKDSVEQVNINTASPWELEKYLENISQSQARKITDYRYENGYFKTVDEIKKVAGFTDRLFDLNKYQMTVVTNINRANYTEIYILGISDYTSRRIVDYREDYGFYSIEDLYLENLISREQFNSIKQFISLGDVQEIVSIDESKKDVENKSENQN